MRNYAILFFRSKTLFIKAQGLEAARRLVEKTSLPDEILIVIPA